MITSVKHTQVVNRIPLVYHTSIDSYETSCYVHSNIRMLCQTAQIELPDNVHHRAKTTRKRDVSAAFMAENIQAISHRIFKRDAVKIERFSNGDTLEFYIGFKLDGVDVYKNYSAVYVYTEPTFHLEVGVIDYKTWMSITFMGDDLDSGITVNDYMIRIGIGTCFNITLLSNSISCYPPESPPQLKDTTFGTNPEIIIHVGTNIEHFAGYVRYTSSKTKTSCAGTTPWKVYTIISATAAAIAVIVSIVLTAVICSKWRNLHKQTQGE